MNKNTIRTARQGWECWRLNRIDEGSLQWLAISRPEARAVIDQTKLWTLIPDRRIFLANWFVTEDHHRQQEPGKWVHGNIDIDGAPEVALEVPPVCSDGLARILRTIGGVDSHPRCHLSVILDIGVRQVDLRRPTQTRPSGRPFTGWLTCQSGIIPGRRLRGARRLGDGRQGRRSGSAGVRGCG